MLGGYGDGDVVIGSCRLKPGNLIPVKESSALGLPSPIPRFDDVIHVQRNKWIRLNIFVFVFVFAFGVAGAALLGITGICNLLGNAIP